MIHVWLAVGPRLTLGPTTMDRTDTRLPLPLLVGCSSTRGKIVVVLKGTALGRAGAVLLRKGQHGGTGILHRHRAGPGARGLGGTLLSGIGVRGNGSAALVGTMDLSGWTRITPLVSGLTGPTSARRLVSDWGTLRVVKLSGLGMNWRG